MHPNTDIGRDEQNLIIEVIEDEVRKVTFKMERARASGPYEFAEISIKGIGAPWVQAFSALSKTSLK